MARSRVKAVEAPISTRPASIRPLKAFIGKNRKAGGKKVGINWDRVEESSNHKLNQDILNREMVQLRLELQEAERLGQPKARRIRRDINSLLEQSLALQSTWCQGCLNYAHRCKCRGIEKEEARRIRKNKNARLQRNEARHDRLVAQFRQKFNIQEV